MYRMSLGLSCITLSLINCSTYQTICLPVALGHCLPWAGPAPLPACTICNCGVLWTAGIQACLSCIYKVMGFWPGDCLGILSSNILEVFWPIFWFFLFFFFCLSIWKVWFLTPTLNSSQPSPSRKSNTSDLGGNLHRYAQTSTQTQVHAHKRKL